MASLRGGWCLLRDDPIGVLLPAAAMLGLQAIALAVIQLIWRDMTMTTLLLAVLAILVARAVLASPFRAVYLASAARRLNRPFSVVARSPGLAVVWAIATLVESLIVGLILLGSFVPAWWFLARGTYWGALLLVSFATFPALLAALGCRVLFAYAAVEVTAGRRSVFGALRNAMRSASSDGVAIVGLLVVGEAAMALGGLLCGAGMLPGAAYADLTLMHRWASRPETP